MGMKFLDYITGSVSRMSCLLSDSLEYSRLSNKGVNFQKLDCNLVVDYVLQNLNSAIEEKSAQVEVEKLPTITANHTQISQVFQNLIGNALKFQGDVPPKITIGCTENSDHFEFYVKDNGIGISPDFHQKIFFIFHRLHAHSDYEGSGIGLATCKKIIENHKGIIRVRSQEGKGSTFYFTIAKDL